jgi:hypothetical protein
MAAGLAHLQNLRKLTIGFLSSLAGRGSGEGPLSNAIGEFDLAIARSSASANDFPSIVATAVAESLGTSKGNASIAARIC